MIWNLLSDIIGGGTHPAQTTPDTIDYQPILIIVSTFLAAVIVTLIIILAAMLVLSKKEKKQMQEEINRLQEQERSREQTGEFAQLSDEEKRLLRAYRSTANLNDTEKPT